jgi:biotin transport system substrate-specific component
MRARTHAGPRDSVLLTTSLIVGAAALTAVAAQISFGYPVPTTLQTFAVFSTAAVLGARRAVAAQLLYLAGGAVGLPVFAEGRSGVDFLLTANLAHASGGYLWGFVLAAGVIGLVADRYGTSFWVMAPAMLLGSVAVYVPGVIWLPAAIPVPYTGSGATVLHYGLWPFVLGDLAKIFAAAAVVDPHAPWGRLVDGLRPH